MNIYQGHEFVDLGLPSGTLWATCNVGANKPEDYGEYFAWGENKPKTIYNWGTYKYADGGPDKLTKYCNSREWGKRFFKDNQTTLQSSDDSAVANWGDGWRMPSSKQWLELETNTIQSLTTKNGVKGQLFTAKNGQAIFLPIAGHRQDDGFSKAGSIGCYWSSTLHEINPFCAYYFNVNSNHCCNLFYDRFYGFSVRPVRSAP